MDYKAYKELVNQHPKPTEATMDRFILYLCNAHSWYKHLPNERTVPFIFYLDPYAGRKLIKVEEKGLSKKVQYFQLESSNSSQLESSNSSQLKLSWQYFTTRSETDNFIPNVDGSIQHDESLAWLNFINEAGIADPFPNEVIEMGTFMMSKWLHGGFENNNMPSGNNMPFGQKHDDIISDLKIHLSSIIEKIYIH